MFYTYMLSPKEAFNIGCGKGSWMDYKAFEKLL